MSIDFITQKSKENDNFGQNVEITLNIWSVSLSISPSSA